jgi:hypothetical protein
MIIVPLQWRESTNFGKKPKRIKILFRKIITAHCNQGIFVVIWCRIYIVFQFGTKIIKIRLQRIVILSVVFYGYENWSLTLKEEHLLRVLQNKVLRRIFGPKRDEVTGEWRELYNEELNDLCSSPNIIHVIKSRRIRWVWL